CRDWREADSRANDWSATNAVSADFGTHRPSRDRKAMQMSTLSIGLALAIRIVLVLLFLPFSALDKVLDFRGAVAQAQEAVSSKAVATALILVGLFVEVFMSAGVVSGIADRACAFVLAGYCAVTALLWKQFWRPGDFWSSSVGKARALFWDFWKNLALAAGFLLIVFGTDASSIAQFFAHPTIQSHPYRLTQEHARP
ncbi:MAG: DoxX family protein, partial [Pseudolabrys sp.]